MFSMALFGDVTWCQIPQNLLQALWIAGALAGIGILMLITKHPVLAAIMIAIAIGIAASAQPYANETLQMCRYDPALADAQTEAVIAMTMGVIAMTGLGGFVRFVSSRALAMSGIFFIVTLFAFWFSVIQFL